MAAEVRDLFDAFDRKDVIYGELKEILGRTIDIEAFVDDRRMFVLIVIDDSTAKGRL